MNFFSSLYDRVMNWSRHRLASWYLAVLSFSESVFFPIPPDVMLAPMALARPKQAWYYAFLTSIASILGGIVGYYLGYALFEPVVQPAIDYMGYQAKFETITQWFEQWGIWIVFIAGFSPIPYKLFTVTAGVLSMALLPL